MFEAVRHLKRAPGQGRGTVAQCTKRTAAHRRLLSIPLGALLALFMGMSGCVPVPYRPSASVSHAPVGGDTAALIEVSSATHRAIVDSLAQSIHEAEPRILVDTRPMADTVFSHGSTLAEILDPTHAAQMAARPADYLLTVGPTVHHKLHDTGDAEPFPYLPVVWVGYEKIQSVDTLCASFADLHEPQTVDGILVSSAIHRGNRCTRLWRGDHRHAGDSDAQCARTGCGTPIGCGEPDGRNPSNDPGSGRRGRGWQSQVHAGAAEEDAGRPRRNA